MHIYTHRSKSCGCKKLDDRNNKYEGVGELSTVFLNDFRRNRRKKGKQFDDDVDSEFLWNLFLKQDRKCALSGVQLHLNRKYSQQKNRPGRIRREGLHQTASIDRIDSTKGYTRDNVQWVHANVNHMKMRMTNENFIEWCKKIAQYRE